MADDEALEITEETNKDREGAEQAKALNAVTDNVSSNSSSGLVTAPHAWRNTPGTALLKPQSLTKS